MVCVHRNLESVIHLSSVGAAAKNAPRFREAILSELLIGKILGCCRTTPSRRLPHTLAEMNTIELACLKEIIFQILQEIKIQVETE